MKNLFYTQHILYQLFAKKKRSKSVPCCSPVFTGVYTCSGEHQINILSYPFLYRLVNHIHYSWAGVQATQFCAYAGVYPVG